MSLDHRPHRPGDLPSDGTRRRHRRRRHRRTARLMPTYRAAAGAVRPRQRHRAVGRRRQRLPRLPRPASPSSSLGHAHPEVADAHRRAGRHAAARLQPVRHRARGRGRASPSTASSAAGARCSSATRVPRPTSAPSSWPASGAATAATSWSAPTARSTAARWPRCTPPASRPSTRPSSRCPRASATSRGTTSTRSRRPSTPPSPPSCSSRCRARAGSTRRRRVTSAASARLCDERGILLMVDEVQTGLGRTGRWFGFQHFGVVPDVVTMAKALGNGVPIGACWARRDVAAAFEPGDHATTFGGQPLAAAAARAVLAHHGARGRCPAWRRRRRGAPAPRSSAELPRVAEVRGLGPAARRRARATALDAKVVGRRRAGRRPRRQRGHARRALRFAPPLTVVRRRDRRGASPSCASVLDGLPLPGGPAA